MKNTFYIFLDVDGVLNTKTQWKRMYQLDRRCIERFGAFAKSLGDCRVVLSSTWRGGFSEDGNHAQHVRELISELSKFDIKIEGTTEIAPQGDRAKEISTYIAKHKISPKMCIVIDDDREIFLSKLPIGCKVLWQDANTGFLEQESRSVIDKLIRCYNLFIR